MDLYSLKLTAKVPETRPKRPTRKLISISTIHFQVLCEFWGRVLLDVHFLMDVIYIYIYKLIPKCQSVNHNKFRCTHSGGTEKNMFFFPGTFESMIFSDVFSSWRVAVQPEIGRHGQKLNKLDCPTKSLAKIRETTIPKSSNIHHSVPAPSKGWCLNPKGLPHSTPYHPLGTPWRVQVEFCSSYNIAKITLPRKVVVVESVLGRHFFQKNTAQNRRFFSGGLFKATENSGLRRLGKFQTIPNFISDLLECRRITNIHHSAQRSFLVELITPRCCC